MAHINLGRIYSSKGNLDDAIMEFKSGLDINPRYLPALVDLANALLQKGEFDEVITTFENLNIPIPE